MIAYATLLPVVGSTFVVCALVAIKRYSKNTTLACPEERAAAIASLAFAVAASVLLLILPIYAGERLQVGPDGRSMATSLGSRNLLDMMGWRVLVPLGLPVLFAAMPVALMRTVLRPALEAIAATFLVGFALMGAVSVGLYYLPSAIAIIVALTIGYNAPSPHL